jgi:hypothetical protein
MAIALRQHLDCHSEVASGFPEIYPLPHQPSCRRVPQCMRGHALTKVRVSDRIGKCLLEGFDWLPVPLYGEVLPAAFPASQVSEQPVRQGYGRSTFRCLPASSRPSVEHPPREIDEAAPFSRLQGGAAHRASACTGI